MHYESLSPIRPVTVEQIVTVHYYEYASGYYFEGERHDFWEFLYVDKGTVDVQADQHTFLLSHGQIIFHQPGEFHALRCSGSQTPNLVVVSFRCTSPEMAFFQNRIMTLGDTGKALLGRIVEEARQAFLTPLDNPLTLHMERRAEAPFGAEALIAGALEELLIRLIRRGTEPVEVKSSSYIHSYVREDMLVRVISYLEDHLDQRLTLEQVCKDNLIGRSRLQQLFRDKMGGGVMEYFGRLKIKAAQEMIREGRYNFTEIAAALGYQSIHYFSRHFKKASGMTPSEYATSVKLLSQKTHIF